VKLEIGLSVEGQEGVSWSQWLDLGRVAEKHGFAALYRSDHYLSEYPGSNRGALDAWGTICGLAAVTSRIRLGTLVSPVTFRHPSVLAKLAVTADHISGGRVDLGIGAGWYAEEHAAYGFEIPELGIRF
jgi:alkanesulfonate monooxygenase SsuD/methylene tetrahydromethanopterin reductase-like flavin-dependent oxidoreductase (luciferase family)